MSENIRKKLDRRSFFGTSMMGAAGLALMPGVLTASPSVASAATADVKLGFIGMGQQSMFLLSGFLQVPGVDVLAGCDIC